MLIRRATATDAPGVTACVCEAYLHYIERIGRQPRPMVENYLESVARNEVHVALQNDRVVGALVLARTAEGFYLDNIAVRPALQGTGLGRQLLGLAERRALEHGYDSIYLATHELMTENQAIYRRTGYVEYDRKVLNGFPGVFFRKIL